MDPKPFLSQGASGGELCILCNSYIKENENVSKVAQNGLQRLRELAERWSRIDSSLPVCSKTPYAEFLLAEPRLSRVDSDIIIHNSCRISFLNRLKRIEGQCSKLQPSDATPSSDSGTIDNIPSTTPYRVRRGSMQQTQICFVCNTASPNDKNAYNDGGIGRCSEDNAYAKLEHAIENFMKDEGHKHYAAANRLKVMLGGTSYDIFAQDVYYHKLCYQSFTYSYEYKVLAPGDMEKERIGAEVMNKFFRLFHRNVVINHDAYLLTELIEDIKELSEDYELSEPPISKTFTLKKKLIEKYGEEVNFAKIGNRLVVHSSDVSPLAYSTATMQGRGLREADLTKAFSRLIRRKISQRQAVKWPLEPDELFSLLDSYRPLQCIFNAIAWSVNPRRLVDANGYVAVQSKVQAEKFSAISQSWEKIVTGERLPLGTVLSLTLHRITGSKEATTLLNRCGVGIAYSDVRELNNNWAKTVTMEHKKMLPPGFIRGRSVHITFDNSDGKQQTLTGAHTTHHTTGTIFQTQHPGEATVSPKQQVQSDVGLLDREEHDYGFFKIPKKRAPPPTFPEFSDGYRDCKLLTDALEKNIAWVVVGALGDDCLGEYFPEVDRDELGPVGSWTTFMKNVTRCSTSKCKLEYLPVVPLPPGDNVIKWYMDMMLQITDDLELDFLFAHADEAINSKMLMISWMDQEKYDKIIPLMGGFHTILVNLKILFKKYGCLGLSDWWIDAGAIADKSAPQANEGRHYARGVRLHKQSFEALLRHRIRSENILGKMDLEMREVIARLRYNSSAENLDVLMGKPEFKELCSSLMKAEGTQAAMITEYLKDVSAMLCLIVAVREKSIETHLAAERILVPKCFAFGHVNYARYLTFQHVNLQNLKINHQDAWNDLVENGFGGSLSGKPFSTIHGDLITETTINREVKVQGGPMHGGYSTNEQATDAFIKTSHIMAKLRSLLKDRLDVLTTSTHKEISIGARKQHEKIVGSLVLQLDKYFNPFLVGPARHMKSGKEIDYDVVKGLLSSSEVGEKQYKEFVDSRLIATGAERVNFFDSIINLKIKTGQEKLKKTPNAINILKEDRQAFGVLVGKATTPEEAHSHPLTTVPLSLATPERDLRMGQKSKFRNYLIQESSSVEYEPIDKSTWLIDGMAAVNSIPSQPTWGEYADLLLKFCLPPSKSKPVQLGIIFDSYCTATTKELTQIRRGTPGRRIHITNANQSMPRGKDWASFLCNSENKTELIKFLVGYYKTDSVRSRLWLPLIVTEESDTWLINHAGIAQLESCNHHEADTRLVYYASKSKDPVIIRATDTDILILLSYGYSVCKPGHDWMMKVDDRYISVNKLVAHFGDKVCKLLPAFHSITGCDTTSYPFGVGKVKPFKKMLKEGKLNKLLSLGGSINTVQDTSDAKCFLQTCMYPGTEEETFVETRIRMYNKQKVKSSSGILPDESSAIEHIKRSNLQARIWYQCLKLNIEYPSITDSGWERTSQGIRPVWFTCPQLPLSLSKKKTKRKNTEKRSAEYDADLETMDENRPARPKKRKSSKETVDAPSKGRKKHGPTNGADVTMEESDQPLHEKEEGEDLVGIGDECFGDDEPSETEDTEMDNASDSDISKFFSSPESDNYSDLDISE